MKLHSTILYLCLLLATCLKSSCARNREMLQLDREEQRIEKIVGGSKAQYLEPYMVLLRDRKGYDFCAGTLIHPRVVLTAAHCVGKKSLPTVDIGRLWRFGDDESGFETAKTVKTIINPDYNKKSDHNDAAILVLDRDSLKSPVQLYESFDCLDEPYGACSFRILGWGKKGKFLKEGFVSNVPHDKCRNRIWQYPITDSMICASVRGGGVDSCSGDSGGPLLLSGKQIGIVSWGLGCGIAGKPGIYTYIPSILPWIKTELNALPNKNKTSEAKEENEEEDPCSCSEDGSSGGISTPWVGCAKHASYLESKMKFCAVKGGEKCKSATPSSIFPGAAWKQCK